MSLLRKSSLWQKALNSRLSILVLVAICAGLSLAVYDRFVVEQEVEERRGDREVELQTLEARQQVLEERVKYLENEQGLEAEIRRHFDVAKEGEQVVVLVGERGEENRAAAMLSQEVEVDVGFWSWLWPW